MNGNSGVNGNSGNSGGGGKSHEVRVLPLSVRIDLDLDEAVQDEDTMVCVYLYI